MRAFKGIIQAFLPGARGNLGQVVHHIAFHAVNDLERVCLIQPFDIVVGVRKCLGGHGKVISFETREIRNERTIIIFSITDFTDTITVKMFVRNEQLAELLGDLKKGAFFRSR